MYQTYYKNEWSLFYKHLKKKSRLKQSRNKIRLSPMGGCKLLTENFTLKKPILYSKSENMEHYSIVFNLKETVKNLQWKKVVYELHKKDINPCFFNLNIPHTEKTNMIKYEKLQLPSKCTYAII